ncbi:MAG TPA: hypothetical protein VE912_06695 [Bacteroidales bacterium]|nr:hypothetical protein [Bacteroidales bacterium]
MKTKEDTLQELAEIRKLMEKSSRFMSLSGLSGIFAGIFALAGATIAYLQLGYHERFFNPPAYFGNCFYRPLQSMMNFFIFDAGIVLVLALGAAFFFSYRKAKRAGAGFFDKTARRLAVHLFLPLIAGGIFCIALIFYHLVFLIGPATLIFYGLALINGSKYSFNELKMLGLSQLLLGSIALFLPGYTIFFWAFGFGVLHIVYGSVMYYRYER